MEKEYISIREFAARANISRQGAYKIINKKFQNYCKIIENKKYIDISAVEELQKLGDKSCQLGDKIVYGDCQLGDKTVALSLQQGHVSVDNHTFQPGDKDCLFGDKSCLLGDKTVDKMVDILNEQLKIKDKQIEAKDKQLETKDKQINELTEMLKDVQSKQNELMCSLKAAQALHAGTLQEHIESKVAEQSSGSTRPRSRSDGSTQLRWGFWHWLFRKRH